MSGLIHHSDRGVAVFSIHYTERIAEAGIEPSAGSMGDSYETTLAETVIGLYKTDLIERRVPCVSLARRSFRTLEWIDWINNRRLLEPIANVPPLEFVASHYRSQN